MNIQAWTVQPLIVWNRLEDCGTLLVDTEYYPDSYVPWQYRWLASQLRERLPGYPIGLPWWAYTTKPDLRWVAHRRKRGEPQVRLELLLDPSETAVFPAWAWNVVFTGAYLAPSHAERQAWEADMQKHVRDENAWPLPEPWRTDLESSWLCLFEPGLASAPVSDRHVNLPVERLAVFGTLRLADVVSITHFMGRCPHSR